MSVHRWLGASFAAAIALAFAACSNGNHGTSGGEGTGAGGAASSSSSSSSSASGMPEAGPLVCSGSSSNIPKGGCDMLQQDCKVPGQTCRPYQTGTNYITACLGGAGLKAAGEDCYSDAECAEKLFCVGGKCSPVCCRTTGEPCGGAICDLSVPFGPYTAFFCHYAPKCTLFADNACEPGYDCHIEDATQGLATCGAPNGTTAPDLGSCTFINDCGNMEQCYKSSANQGECHYYCMLSAAPGTPAGKGGCPPGQGCFSKWAGNPVDFGVPGNGLCFPTGSPPPDGGPGDAGPGDAGPGDAATD
jgi:hypothetical protein